MKRIYTLIGVSILCIMHNFINAQGISNDQKIAQVYGSVATTIPTDAKTFLNNCISRCQVLNISMALSDSVKSISTLKIQKKYVSNLTDTNNPFNESTFNPLIYVIDFFNNKDQYFVIDASHTLKVAKKN